MGQEWIFYARFMEFCKFEESRNSGLKYRQDLPLQISVSPTDYQALQHLCQPPTPRKVAEWEFK